MPSRSPRRDIAGARGWQVNANGDVFKHRKRKAVTNIIHYLPTVDFGNDYKGFLLAAGAHKGMRLLDEIVCLEFNGWPPMPEFLTPYQAAMRMGRRLWWSSVEHLDGDDWNCSADNLRWSVDDELAAYTLREIMWPDSLVKENWRRGKQRASVDKRKRKESETNYVSSPHVVDWLPVNHTEGREIA